MPVSAKTPFDDLVSSFRQNAIWRFGVLAFLNPLAAGAEGHNAGGKTGGWTRRTFVWRLDTADNCRSCLAFGHGGQLSVVPG